MGRYYEASSSVYNLLGSLVDERFNHLTNTKFKIFMDTKTRVDKLTERVVLAYIKLTSEVERLLTQDDIGGDGVDYFLFLNSLVWELANDVDKKRILSHELRHCFIDDKGNYKLIKHDIEDFYEELKLNEDDPMWAQALSTIAIAKLEQLKRDGKQK